MSLLTGGSASPITQELITSRAAQALARPRFHDQLIPNQMTFEYPYSNATVAYLAGLGHNVTWVAPGQAHCQAVRRLRNGTFEAAAEPRMLESGGYVF